MIKKTIFAGLLVWVVFAAFCGSVQDVRAEGSPKRIVSFNLCADQLLLALADPAQIAGLSPYAVNPLLSVMTDKAAAFPRLDWDAESVVNLKPDLVLGGPSHRPIHAMLSAMGIRVVDVELIRNLADARRQAIEVGKLVGHPERGEALARQIEQAEARLSAVALKPPLTALVIQREGYREGPASLASGMLSIAGLRPPQRESAGAGGFMSAQQGGFVSLEHLLTDGPDVLVLQDPPREAQDQGALFITHPALLARYGANRRIDLPERYTLCGGPPLLQGLDYLATAIKTLK
ncbi:MAG: ABC transporter substrate-binding protein [Afipia sp.]|jgi:iron complex transport system substrate-binding protein|nr:ABC transporter substrate-binding protein [Afipia sp.]MBS4005184.1 ABC transporter substrate-binding protein [Afipia sp.]WIG53777.1 MAG: Vitamin B12 ABC transporter, substrate-binding protein BtuF [Afipia sp.]